MNEKRPIATIRPDFPILTTTVDGHPLVYLDNAATTHKPQGVIDAITNFYRFHNANIHRTVYRLAETATEQFEAVREKVARFIHAQDSCEIIFTKGTTEGINLVAQSWARHHVKAGDEILVSGLEHHSNLIPWQQVCKETGAVLRIIPVLADGTLDMAKAHELMTGKTKLLAIIHVSNMLGTQVDVASLSRRAHEVGARVLVDAAQSIAHQPINVTALGCDFLAFSGHKMLGPTGVGVLYINRSVHDQMTPYQYGGGMIMEATYDGARFLTAPRQFEAGTPHIAGVIGLGAALDYIQKNIPFDELRKHEAALVKRTIAGLSCMPRIRLLGPLDHLATQGHLISFVVEGMHAHDVAAYCDRFGICIRAGHHCAQPLARQLGVDAAARISFYAYNTMQEVEIVLEVLERMVADPLYGGR